MSTSCSDVVAALDEALAQKGYCLHNGNAETGEVVDDESGEDWWWTWGVSGMSGYESGETCGSLLQAQQSAMAHWFENAEIPVERVGEEPLAGAFLPGLANRITTETRDKPTTVILGVKAGAVIHLGFDQGEVVLPDRLLRSIGENFIASAKLQEGFNFDGLIDRAEIIEIREE